MKKLTLKSKLIILCICSLSLLFIFTTNVVKKYNIKNDREIILRDEQMITFKEAKYLLHSLGIEEGDFKYKANQKIGSSIVPGKESEGNSKEEYVETDIEFPDDSDYVRFKDLLYLIPSATYKLDLDRAAILEGLSFKVEEEKDSKALSVSEFLEIYENILNSIPADSAPVREEDLFILGKPDRYKDDVDMEIMASNQGNFEFTKALNYSSFYIDGELIKEDKDNNTDEEKGSWEEITSSQFNLEDYINYKVTAMVTDDELVYVKGTLDEETILYNVWIAGGSGQTVTAFAHEVTKDFHAKSNLSEDINEVVGDLIIKNHEIIGIRIKPDRINGKVLVTDKEYIEVEGYGQIPLDEDYKIYKIYDELAQELTNSILVGYETTDFIVAEGKVVAALIKGEITAENIRVLIKTNQFQDYYHNEVSFTSNSEFSVTSGENTQTHPAGTQLTVKQGDEALSEGRLIVKPTSETGKIQLLSVDRSYGNPQYRGSVEIASSEEGIIVINELPLEEYLYGVVPSEMPSSYGLEALKSQAVCARSYAYNNIMANSLKEYGAHVDDSVSFQVYNNIEESEETILAVKDTYGKVLTYEGTVINAYYFSTSSGHTASVGEVWSGDQPYLTGKLQTVTSGDDLAVATQNEVDFSNEEIFRDFILNPSESTYDSQVPWYRWKVSLPYSDLTQSINSRIAGRYNANSEYIQTLVTNEGGEEVYESQPVESIGSLQDVQIVRREKSGILTEIKLIGSDKTVKVIGEYNIRTLLSPENQTITLQDGSETSQNMLPSAFCVMDKGEGSVTISGGGYGHGVGMSQNGAKAMASQGKNYEEILGHYYTGIQLTYIYE